MQELHERLHYKGYKNKYQINDIVQFKNIDDIIKINSILYTSAAVTLTKEDLKEFKWCVFEEDAERIENYSFRVLGIIFYHGGIPLNRVVNILDGSILRVAEFYLIKI